MLAVSLSPRYGALYIGNVCINHNLVIWSVHQPKIAAAAGGLIFVSNAAFWPTLGLEVLKLEVHWLKQLAETKKGTHLRNTVHSGAFIKNTKSAWQGWFQGPIQSCSSCVVSEHKSDNSKFWSVWLPNFRKRAYVKPRPQKYQIVKCLRLESRNTLTGARRESNLPDYIKSWEWSPIF